MLEHNIDILINDTIEDRAYIFGRLNQLEKEYYKKKERLYYDLQRWYRQCITSTYISSEDLIVRIREVEDARMEYLNFKTQVLAKNTLAL